MLFTLIRGGNFIDAIVFVLSSVFVVFLVLPIHEFAHALTATKLGDNTAKWQGRLSINPMRHIDWFGAVMIILVGFGWAKPVPVNPARFRHPKSDMALVSLAGPMANLLMGIIFFILCAFTQFIAIKAGIVGVVTYYIALFFMYIGSINISLAVFNLIPLPPLDGAKVLGAFLPERIYYTLLQYERQLSLILIVLICTGAASNVLSTVTSSVSNGIYSIACAMFGL